MNLNRLLSQYFPDLSSAPTIEVFDETNLFIVYKHIIETLQMVPEIEQNVIKGLAFCLYEVLDNVITHSGKKNGTVLFHYSHEQRRMRLVVADDGVGIKDSMSKNPLYKDIDEAYAIQICIQKNVTDGNGMGFGLFSTSRLVDHVGISMQIQSGDYLLIYDGKESIVKDARNWQGTVVFLDLHSDQDFNPDEIAKDCVEEYDEMFLDDEETALW